MLGADFVLSLLLPFWNLCFPGGEIRIESISIQEGQVPFGGKTEDKHNERGGNS